MHEQLPSYGSSLAWTFQSPIICTLTRTTNTSATTLKINDAELMRNGEYLSLGKFLKLCAEGFLGFPDEMEKTFNDFSWEKQRAGSVLRKYFSYLDPSGSFVAKSPTILFHRMNTLAKSARKSEAILRFGDVSEEEGLAVVLGLSCIDFEIPTDLENAKLSVLAIFIAKEVKGRTFKKIEQVLKDRSDFRSLTFEAGKGYGNRVIISAAQ